VVPDAVSFGDRKQGRRPGDELGRIGRLPFARDTRRYSKTSEPNLSVVVVHQNIGGLYIFMDQTSLMHLANG
jgi:hypothetical protein